MLNLGIIIFKLKKSNEFESYENDICYISKSFLDILARVEDEAKLIADDEKGEERCKNSLLSFDLV